MTTKSPERELSLIQKALGEGLDAKLWPKRLSAPAAVQRLVNLVTESDHLATITRLEERVHELEAEREAMVQAHTQHASHTARMQQDLEQTKQRLEEVLYRRDDLQAQRDDFQAQWQEEIERSTRLERALAEARAESVLAIADRIRETAVGVRDRVKARLGRA